MVPALDPEELSPLDKLCLLPKAERDIFLSKLSQERAQAFLYDWRNVTARPKQLAPEGDWLVWFIRSGRGWGKTRTGAETVRLWKETAKRIALVGRTGPDVRKTMVEGESGILAIAPPWDQPKWEPGNKRLFWGECIIELYSGDEPAQLRGPQWEKAWIDEPAHWKYPQKAFDNLMFGLRLGKQPQVVATTTPLPIKMIQELSKQGSTYVTTGSSYENRFNLARAYYERNIKPYEDTRLGRQEIWGEILDDVPGALWTRKLIDDSRVDRIPELVRTVIAIDPAVSHGEDSDETGMGVASLGIDGRVYVCEDLTCKLPAAQWAERAVGAFERLGANEVVAEVNNGGDLVARNLQAVRQWLPVRSVHATRGKVKRAEPVATLYEKDLVKHLGSFPELEDQMVLFTPEGGFATSPDRVDWLVWAVWALVIEPAMEQRRAVYEDDYRVSAY